VSDSSSPENIPPIIAPNPGSETNRFRWAIHLFVIAVFPLAIGAFRIGSAPTHGPALADNAKGLLIACAEQLAIFAVIFLVAWLASRASRDDLLWRWRPGVWTIPLGIAYSVALRLAIGIIAAVLIGALLVTRLISSDRMENVVQSNVPDVGAVVDVPALEHDPAYLLLSVTVASFVLGGLREELWRAAFLAGFRRLWPRYFGKRGGEMVAVLLAAVLFGAGHLVQGPIAAVMAGLLGVGLGAIIVIHRSIWPAVIAHGMFDATSLALIPWAMHKLQELRHLAH
jgi:membrane protease YdiL (CAAX protease family)